MNYDDNFNAPDVLPLAGGALRWSQPAGVDQTPTTPAPTTRVYGGTTRTTFQGDRIVSETAGPARYAHSSNGTEGGGVMATYEAMFGKPSVELEPGNPASRTDLDVAHRLGLVRPRPGGGWEDVEEQQAAIERALAPAPEAPQEDPGAGVFSPAEDQEYQALIEPIPQYAYDSVQASMVALLAHGKGSIEDVATSLSASTNGIEPSQAKQLVEKAHAHYSRVAARALAPMGLQGERLESAYRYMQAKHPARLQEAIQRLTHGRDVSMFRELALAYKVDNPGDLSALRAAGFETRVDRETGDVMVRRGQGGWVRVEDL